MAGIEVGWVGMAKLKQENLAGSKKFTMGRNYSGKTVGSVRFWCDSMYFLKKNFLVFSGEQIIWE